MLRIIFIMVLCFSVAACHRDTVKTASPKTVYIVKEQTLPRQLFFSGMLAPMAVVNVPSPVDGFVVAKNFEYGQRVVKGQIIAKIHSESLQKDYNSALTVYLKSKQDLATSDAKLKSDAELYHLGIIARDTYKQSKNTSDSNRVAFLQAVNALKEALKKGSGEFSDLAHLDISNINAVDKALKQEYNHLDVVALADGVALMPAESNGSTQDKSIMVGSKVETGRVMVSIGDLSGLSVSIEISENDVAEIIPGTAVTISSSAFPHLVLQGVVQSVDSQAKPSNNYNGNQLPLFGAKIVVPSLVPDMLKLVRVGMSAKIAVQLPQKSNLVVPINAITEKHGQYWVQRLNHGIEEAVLVETGIATDALVEVQKGLKAGDSIVVAANTNGSEMQERAKSNGSVFMRSSVY